MAIWVRVSVSRNTQLLAIAKMLASSWVTITTVAPKLSRSCRIRSSSNAELIGSRPADGSSKNRSPDQVPSRAPTPHVSACHH